jgi:hypothetical protein
VSTAVQAAEAFVHGRAIKFVEIQDMNIPKALVIDEDSAGAETLFIVRSRDYHGAVDNGSILEAEFACYSCSDDLVLDKGCDGRLLIHLGQRASGDLPPNHTSQAELLPLDFDSSKKPSLDLGSFITECSVPCVPSIGTKASAPWAKGELGEQYTLHRAILDVGFQAGFAAFPSIAETAMGSTYLPAGIRRVIADPTQIYRGPLGERSIEIEAHLANRTSTILEVDINHVTN